MAVSYHSPHRPWILRAKAVKSTPEKSGSVVVGAGGSVVVGGAVVTAIVVVTGASFDALTCPTQKMIPRLARSAPAAFVRVSDLNSLLLGWGIMRTPYFGCRAFHIYYHFVTETCYIIPQLVRRAGTLC